MKMNIKLGEIFAQESLFFFNQEPKLETSAKACKEEDDHNY